MAHPPDDSGTRVVRPWPGWLAAAAGGLAFAVLAAALCLAEAGLL